MGWCSATEIMDAATQAADALMLSLRTHNEPLTEEEREAADDVLRPFVATIAGALRDGDWDCIEEAGAFGRFPQEMLGYDDQRMADWYREQIGDQEDPDQIRALAERLAFHMERLTSGR